MNTPRYQHIRFHTLKLNEDFFYRRQRYTKTSYFLGRTVLDGRAVVVMPWTKIRSTRPFGKVPAPRPPQVVEGHDITSETIGGSELTPSA